MPCSGNIAEQCGTEHNITGDGLGQKETNTGMAGDGSNSAWKQTGMEVNGAGTGRMGLKSPPSC